MAVVSQPVAGAWGGHSMVAPLRRVLVNAPLAPRDVRAWEAFGYVRPVDYDLALREHRAFCALLSAAGCEVIVGEYDDQGLQDAIFTFDPSIITDAGAILCSMGKQLRRLEVDLAEQAM
ncbi:MAG: amidinotransferase [Chloroflexi bacterium]|nr:amidinotransferase [Chloroflexota bacterium]